ncbi:MAG: hypothetical protein PSV36_03970 [Algoriphagus sp.]|nr:hypothetical protein [Algoriphagus sp.]
MKIKFLFVFITFLALTSCWPLKEESKVVELKDLSQMSNTSVSAGLKEGQYVYKISLKIEGETDGSFEINNYKFNPGKVDTLINNMDWYQEDFPIAFKPVSCSEGNLKVKVTFFLQE